MIYSIKSKRAFAVRALSLAALLATASAFAVEAQARHLRHAPARHARTAATDSPAPAPAAPATAAPSQAPLSANDVSWLFPPPRNAADLDKTIAIADLTAPDPKDATKREAIWPAAVFAQFIANAESPATGIGNDHRISLPAGAHDVKSWRIAGLRIDPGAPGLTSDIIAQFGQSPQLRFILQPVTRKADGGVEVHDVAAHVIYTFSAGKDAPAETGCSAREKPDMEAFRKLARDFAGLRDDLAAGKFGGAAITTAGKPLGVHPGLADNRTAKPLKDALAAVLERHLSGGKLNAMAVMGLPSPAPEPWIFMAMAPVPPGVVPSLPNGGFIPVRGPTLDGKQTAQGLSFVDDTHVMPTPAPNNLNPITCKHAALLAGEAALPVAQRKGLATAPLFQMGDAPVSDPKKVATIQETVDLVADADRSHFFNTDCVSCHTDTRRAMDLLKKTSVPGVDSAALPKEKWNVRNFGWFPSFFRRTLEPTATRRTASETEAVVKFINANGLANP